MILDMSDGGSGVASQSMSYKEAGVDVEKGDQLVDWLNESDSASTRQDPRILSGIGGFAAIFRPEFHRYKDPCLVAATDGVGTKILLGAKFKRFEVVAQDLVAMCVNDLICTGADPLFFLDYYATGRLELDDAQSFLRGVRKACSESSALLIGGETAEMPGLYSPPDFDAAGFAVGIVDRASILGPDRVTAGSVAYGIPSSGFHSNGYSLLRKVFAKEIESADQRILDWLLTPTALYPKLMADLKHEWATTSGTPDQFPVLAVAHITGGGMENIPRVLPRDHELALFDWAWPEPFLEVQDRIGASRIEMLKTLNCGIGLVILVDSKSQNWFEASLQKTGSLFQYLGAVQRSGCGESRVVY